MTKQDCQKYFKFGDSPPVCSDKLVAIPAYISDKCVTIKTYTC